MRIFYASMRASSSKKYIIGQIHSVILVKWSRSRCHACWSPTCQTILNIEDQDFQEPSERDIPEYYQSLTLQKTRILAFISILTNIIMMTYLYLIPKFYHLLSFINCIFEEMISSHWQRGYWAGWAKDDSHDILFGICGFSLRLRLSPKWWRLLAPTPSKYCEYL